MIFDNRPPINLESAEKVACAMRDGGCYNGIGADRYTVYRGKRWHLVHYYSSGCDYGSGTSSSRNHLGLWPTLEELGEWLTRKIAKDGGCWWASELLVELGVPAEDA